MLAAGFPDRGTAPVEDIAVIDLPLAPTDPGVAALVIVSLAPPAAPLVVTCPQRDPRPLAGEPAAVTLSLWGLGAAR